LNFIVIYLKKKSKIIVIIFYEAFASELSLHITLHNHQ